MQTTGFEKACLDNPLPRNTLGKKKIFNKLIFDATTTGTTNLLFLNGSLYVIFPSVTTCTVLSTDVHDFV